MLKKLIILAVLAAIAYWLVKDRLSGDADEFIFTEEPAGSAEDVSQAA